MKTTTGKTFSGQRIATENHTKYDIYSRSAYINTSNIGYLGFILLYFLILVLVFFIFLC